MTSGRTNKQQKSKQTERQTTATEMGSAYLQLKIKIEP